MVHCFDPTSGYSGTLFALLSADLLTQKVSVGSKHSGSLGLTVFTVTTLLTEYSEDSTCSICFHRPEQNLPEYCTKFDATAVLVVGNDHNVAHLFLPILDFRVIYPS